jgi:hypothetical protein
MMTDRATAWPTAVPRTVASRDTLLRAHAIRHARRGRSRVGSRGAGAYATISVSVADGRIRHVLIQGDASRLGYLAEDRRGVGPGRR